MGEVGVFLEFPWLQLMYNRTHYMWPSSVLCHHCERRKLGAIDVVVMETRHCPCKGFEVNTKFLLKYM